jgi:spore maturation protein CgeB
LERLERQYGSPAARALYCSADRELYYPEWLKKRWMLGYLGTYSLDRQYGLEEFLVTPARRIIDEQFIVAGPSYPEDISWPPNVSRINHLPPNQHRAFYCAQKFTLNLTRADMRSAGYSPSVRFFEAAACSVPIISDVWDGIETFFKPGQEILLVRTAAEVTAILRELPDREREQIGLRACERVLREHTARHRAAEFTACLTEAGLAPLGPGIRTVTLQEC